MGRNKDKNQMKPPQKIPEPVTTETKPETTGAATRRKRSCTQQAKSQDKEDNSNKSSNVLVVKEDAESKTVTNPQKSSKKLKKDTVTASNISVPDIPLNSNALLTEPQELLAHNYPVLEEETLYRLTEARKRIR